MPHKTAAELFDELKQSLKQTTINGLTFFIVEGDLLLDEDLLLVYAVQRAHALAGNDGATAADADRLVAIVDDSGRMVRWAKGLVLTYTIHRATFTSEQYLTVVQNMRIAAAEWEAVCGVNFSHFIDQDEGGDKLSEDTLFRVQGIDVDGKFIAAAFFPNSPSIYRHIYIDPSYFSPALQYNPIGVLRHELGHVLGFRHEHIRSEAPPICPDESLDRTINLSDYDPRSVMHYFCGGVGSRELAITEIDRRGARNLYGPPDHEVVFYT
jgi:hypothetical protein